MIHKDVKAVTLAAVSTKGAQTDLGGTQEVPKKLSAVPPADAVTEC
jgi:hypothetical protein